MLITYEASYGLSHQRGFCGSAIGASHFKSEGRGSKFRGVQRFCYSTLGQNVQHLCQYAVIDLWFYEPGLPNSCFQRFSIGRQDD